MNADSDLVKKEKEGPAGTRAGFRAGAVELGEAMVAVDLETGGFIPGVHALLSIGADAGGGDTFHVLVLPEEDAIVEMEAVKVNGYTRAGWEWGGAKSLGLALAEFQEWLTELAKKRGARLMPVAHCAPFERKWIEWMEQVLGSPLGLNYRWRCSQAVLGFLMDVGMVPNGSASLDALCSVSGVYRPPGAHGALSDATACREGYLWEMAQVTGLRAENQSLKEEKAL